MKKQEPWHTDSVLPIVITRGVPTDDYKSGVAALSALMMQFRRGFVPGNHKVIEARCRGKAKLLNKVRPRDAKPVDEQRWFERGIRGLHRSQRQHEAKKAADDAGIEIIRQVADPDSLLGRVSRMPAEVDAAEPVAGGV